LSFFSSNIYNCCEYFECMGKSIEERFGSYVKRYFGIEAGNPLELEGKYDLGADNFLRFGRTLNVLNRFHSVEELSRPEGYDRVFHPIMNGDRSVATVPGLRLTDGPEDKRYVKSGDMVMVFRDGEWGADRITGLHYGLHLESLPRGHVFGTASLPSVLTNRDYSALRGNPDFAKAFFRPTLIRSDLADRTTDTALGKDFFQAALDALLK
jgi:hypothetical protein